ncbi:hypothetical protein BV898_14923 [Hypsibius exemplaris]|uniref:Uncharacterized protein n=1 Tax=Hypsibius exemplaris TaxID=2072580 RepID=A0A9X6RJZ2_HYPEX|nr:hypothetical protein BV898_14923 [Hypsibius exemplaris]
MFILAIVCVVLGAVLSPSVYGQSVQYPYAQGLATSNGTNPSGTLNLGNTASASYNPADGFQASSNTQNVATGPYASIVSSAVANVVTGNAEITGLNILANGNAFSNGNAATGTLENLDQGSAWYTNQVLGTAQSQIQGSGTMLNLWSTANATAYAEPPKTLSKALIEKKKKSITIRDVIFPYAQAAASSAATNPDGSINLSNIAQSTYNANNGFQAQASSHNSASGSGASIQSSAGTSVSTGNTGKLPYTVVGDGSANSLGNALTGTLQNLDRANGSFGSNVIGVGVSQIQGNGTSMQLSSTANGNTIGQAPNISAEKNKIVAQAPLKLQQRKLAPNVRYVALQTMRHQVAAAKMAARPGLHLHVKDRLSRH